MIYVQCPARVAVPDSHKPWVFIAGGISNCPDWQSEMVRRINIDLKLDDEVVVINPRRKDFDILDPEMTVVQIEWEHEHLDNADVIMFWFPFHTLCPITLYELGVYAARGTKLIVGCHPAYAREVDVRKQLSLIRPDITVHDNWVPMLDELKAWYDNPTRQYNSAGFQG